jgi:hypothetical protein
MKFIQRVTEHLLGYQLLNILMHLASHNLSVYKATPFLEYVLALWSVDF